MNTGIIGASGYTGELLVALLAKHPHVNLTRVCSRSLADTLVTEAFPNLRGQLPGLQFSNPEPTSLAQDNDVDLYFLALPHGVASEYAIPLVKAGKKVIDLSADFRLDSPERYQEFYEKPHPAPELLRQAAYVIPELFDKAWHEAALIACPGCYPTSIIVPLAPLLKDQVIGPQSIVINSLSGVSGAGKNATSFFSFCERTESALAYSLPKHRHLSEIEEQLSLAAAKSVVVQFSPHLIPMKRGLLSTITVPSGGHSIEELYACWHKQFSQTPFVSVLEPGLQPDTAKVSGTNRVDISAVHDPRTDNFVISSALDNLMKGAGGQAIQIMNLWLGYEPTSGLL